MTESDLSSPVRVKFMYNGKSITRRRGAPVPRVGERVNIRGEAIRHDATDGIRRFVVRDVLYLLDDRSADEDGTGMLARVTLDRAPEQDWHVENEAA